MKPYVAMSLVILAYILFVVSTDVLIGRITAVVLALIGVIGFGIRVIREQIAS